MGRTKTVNGDLALKPSEFSTVALENVEISPEALNKLMSAEDCSTKIYEVGNKKIMQIAAAM